MESHEGLIAAADEALYRAKAGRKAAAGEKFVAGAPPEADEARGWDKALADAGPEAEVSGDFNLTELDRTLDLTPDFEGDGEGAGG